MSNISTYLKNLLKQKKNLATNLTNKEAQATESEILDTLVPKVLDIQGRF